MSKPVKYLQRLGLWMLALTLLFTGNSTCSGQSDQTLPIVPRPQAHAHNDYLHERPLLDALANGFCSVEADIFLENGELLVGHTKRELASGRTLQSLYLDPLKERINENHVASIQRWKRSRY